MLFGSVLKEIQAPQWIPTLDREHSHGVGNIHIGWGFPKIWQGTTIFSETTDSSIVNVPLHLTIISVHLHIILNPPNKAIMTRHLMNATKARITTCHPRPAIESHEPKDHRISTSVGEINITTWITSPLMHLCCRTTLSVTGGEHHLSCITDPVLRTIALLVLQCRKRINWVSQPLNYTLYHWSSRILLSCARHFALTVSPSSSHSSPITPLAEGVVLPIP